MMAITTSSSISVKPRGRRTNRVRGACIVLLYEKPAHADVAPGQPQTILSRGDRSPQEIC
jgi:hypothetical protein